MPIPLPDFAIAPLQAIDPKALLRNKDDSVGALMLGLAAAYNDLKGVDYCIYELGLMKVQAQADTLERRGQFAGMGHQAVRTTMGIIHEILVLLNNARSAVAEREFQGYVQRLNKPYRADWDSVWAIATSADRVPNRSDALSQILMKARNSLAFHYSRNALAEGYQKHFAVNNPATFSDRALVSIGANMEETRFHYADAAAVAGLSHVTGVEGEDLTHRVSGVGQRLNRVLYALLRQFIDARSPIRYPYPVRPKRKRAATVSTRAQKNKAKRKRRRERARR